MRYSWTGFGNIGQFSQLFVILTWIIGKVYGFLKPLQSFFFGKIHTKLFPYSTQNCSCIYTLSLSRSSSVSTRWMRLERSFLFKKIVNTRLNEETLYNTNSIMTNSSNEFCQSKWLKRAFYWLSIMTMMMKDGEKWAQIKMEWGEKFRFSMCDCFRWCAARTMARCDNETKGKKRKHAQDCSIKRTSSMKNWFKSAISDEEMIFTQFLCCCCCCFVHWRVRTFIYNFIK